MNIKYAGPRPIISQHGITFKDGKEDKYVYLIIAVQILKAIDKDYEEHKSYSYDVSTKRSTDEELLKTMLSYEPDLEKEALQEEINYEKHLQEEIEVVNQRADLKDIEKSVWINNLNVMQKYKIQRAVNKIYYMHCIKDIATIIKREQIKEIDTPFFEKYWHVLQTIQGALSEGRDSVGTQLDVVNSDDGSMISKLTVNY